MNIRKYFTSVIIICLMLIAVALGQTNQQKVADAERQKILELIKQFHLASGSLAYRSAVIPRMLNEANFFARRLNLPVSYPIQFGEIESAHVNPPFYSRIENTNETSAVERIRTSKIVVSGFVEITNYGFYFNKGKLWNIVRLDDPAMNPDRFHELSTKPSLITTSNAYQLATQWLSAISVDVPTLGQKYKLSIYQWYLSNSSGKTNQIMLPIFDVKWGEGQMPFGGLAAKITILGTTKDLMEIQVGDGSLSHRPQMIITNAFELCSIPDPPLKQLQRPPMSQTNSP